MDLKSAVTNLYKLEYEHEKLVREHEQAIFSLLAKYKLPPDDEIYIRVGDYVLRVITPMEEEPLEEGLEITVHRLVNASGLELAK